MWQLIWWLLDHLDGCRVSESEGDVSDAACIFAFTLCSWATAAAYAPMMPTNSYGYINFLVLKVVGSSG